MRYTLRDFQRQFPDDESCLKLLMEFRFGNTCPKCGTVKTKFYRIKTRMSFKCASCRQQIYPLKDTIFERSTTPLTLWFHALYEVSVSKNGMSALELKRKIGVSYKTAHRMLKHIRILMEDKGKIGMLGTPVETDEAYNIAGKGNKDDRTAVLASLEVGGEIRTAVVDRATAKTALPFLKKNVTEGATLHTDESKIYKALKVKKIYNHESVRHIAREFVRDDITTNRVEGFFGQLKRSIDGTYHAVSPAYLSSYVSEFAFRYNHRNEDVFSLLLTKAGKPV